MIYSGNGHVSTAVDKTQLNFGQFVFIRSMNTVTIKTEEDMYGSIIEFMPSFHLMKNHFGTIFTAHDATGGLGNMIYILWNEINCQIDGQKTDIQLYQALASISKALEISQLDLPSTRTQLSPLIREAQIYMEDAILDPDFKIDNLIDKLAISRTTFNKLFKEEVGVCPGQYITQIRMTYALDLIISTPCPVNDIAHHCGYRSYSNFYTLFKKHYGQTPYYFRKNQSDIS
ncbi:helix-turn-helix domain-containing protein [Hutsoniella sourekii]